MVLEAVDGKPVGPKLTAGYINTLFGAAGSWTADRPLRCKFTVRAGQGPQCSNLTPIFIGMHRNAPLSPMKRVPGYTMPLVPVHLPPMAPMHLVE
jgi:hypothetical protein